MKVFVVIIQCFLIQVQLLEAQTSRFLEKKNIEEDFKTRNSNSVFLSINNANTYLLAFARKMTFTDDAQKSKINNSSILLNLQTGRAEFKSKGLSAMISGNVMSVFDYSYQEDLWEAKHDFSKERVAKVNSESYSIDLATKKQFKNFEIEPPTGYGFPLGGHPVKTYYFVSSVTPPYRLSKAEKSDGKLLVKKDYDILYQSGRISRDSTKVYGMKMDYTAKIFELNVYDIQSDQLLSTLKLKEGPIATQLLSSGSVLCQYYDGTGVLYDKSGNVISSFTDIANSSTFLMSADEKNVLTVSQDGLIKYCDLQSGTVLAEARDTKIINTEESTSGSSGKKATYGITISGGAFYLIPYSSGIMSLFSASEQKVVAEIFMDLDDWAVIAKDGRVDGTAGAFEKLEWRDYDGKKLVQKTSLESTFDKYYTPRLLYSIISGETPKSAPDIGNDIRKVPSVTLQKINEQSFSELTTAYNSDKKNINVTVRVSVNNDLVNEVRLYNNGKLSGVQQKNESGTYTFAVKLNSVYGEKNFIYALASTSGGIDSERCKFMVNYSGSDSEKPKLYVLIVGINKYQNPKYELNYALPDAEAIRTQLASSKSALFESVEIKSLFDGQATKTAILQAFSELSPVVREQDLFVFYFAGHGTMSEDPKGSEFYIVPFDVVQLYGNEALLANKAISASEIKKSSLGINAQKQVFILDACQSAGALTSLATRGAAEERAIGQLARSTGTFWLTAAGSDQFATEFQQLGHGIFTYSLLEALQGKDPASILDGTLTVRELSSYVEQRVPELSQKYKGKPQYPASFSFGNDFPILMINKNGK
jgi:hypothetical protein